MLLVYSPNITPRLQYVLKVVFKNCIKAEYELTGDIEEFKGHHGPRLSYGSESVTGEPFIYAEGLLGEKDLRPTLPQKGPDFNGLPTLFETTDTKALLPFDIFSAAFYLVTRYEEYLPHERDEHDRFIPTQSINYQYNFLNKPIVNNWAIILADRIELVYPGFTWQKPTFNFVSTIDIDNAYAYAHKGFFRSVGALAQDVLEFKFNQISERLKSWGNDLNDPYNTFPIIEGLQQRYNHKLQWFVLIGDYGFNDKNPDWENRAFQKLIKRLSETHTMGLHPSYASYRHVEKVHEERERVHEVIGRPINTARCHFLRLKFPDTYRGLKYCGIRHDYTMIHANFVGFRAGIATPYLWYDLPREEETPLMLHPSTVMEGTLRDYMKLCPAEASAAITELMGEVKAVGGEFISIWHNDSFSAQNAEWVAVYEKMVSNR